MDPLQVSILKAIFFLIYFHGSGVNSVDLINSRRRDVVYAYMWLLSGVVNMKSVALPTVYFLNTFQPQYADVKAQTLWKIWSTPPNDLSDHWLDQPSPNGGHGMLHSKDSREKSHVIYFIFPIKMLIIMQNIICAAYHDNWCRVNMNINANFYINFNLLFWLIYYYYY